MTPAVDTDPESSSLEPGRLAEEDLYLGEIGEGRLAATLLLLLVAGLAVIVAVFSPVGPVTWMATTLGLLFGALAAHALRGGDR
ncbi:hypothetical protein ACFS2C_28100 [Prauserella oleivorans]|uniref:DUF3040 domain-containing protein n=1 Tax=Prauserella oleivorans TaxID=1478153 RepID=A0ABW5WLK4_9PSEU